MVQVYLPSRIPQGFASPPCRTGYSTALQPSFLYDYSTRRARLKEWHRQSVEILICLALV